MYRPENLEAKISRLDGIGPYYWDDRFECNINESGGIWNHAPACPSNYDDSRPDFACPYKARLENFRYFLRLQRRPFLKAMFCDPELAAWSEMMEDQNFLISHW